ncbi:hypothetical protein QKT49_gp150 [Acanthamoeba castellanii medusavirus]|uniref:Uncharacterized protein n=1 Tax=Acanthamoeba castellanii medusavirus J1 TaxID=3114988 RepID=A0A3T1CWS7_9VIRU|nr:hypothetical protein QKT49_gp150 [Acanthamoeba castellanii medusavirus]BBI30290.1 hypothetical protein [Acanthamoeba castellanii medusavirus J1]
MQDFLAREDEFNRRVLTPILDGVWKEDATCVDVSFECGFGCYYTREEGAGWLKHEEYDGHTMQINDFPPGVPTTRECMEASMLKAMRALRTIYTSDPFSVDAYSTGKGVSYRDGYLYNAVEALSSRWTEGEPVDVRSFFSWEDEIALYRSLLHERSKPAEGRFLAVDEAVRVMSDALRHSECWLKRIHACEAIRSQVLNPAQLAMAEELCQLNKD